MAVGNRTFRIVLALLVAMLLAALVLLTPAWSQQKQKQGLGGKRGADRSLVGAAVEVQNGENRKNRVDAGDVFKIPVKNLRAAQDATITLRDGDGTQAELVNNKNASFSTTKQSMSVRVTDEISGDGGDGRLNTKGVEIIEEDGVVTIIIDPDSDEDTPDGYQYDESDQVISGDEADNPNEGEETTPPLPQDDDKGPLVGATGIGKDILVPGDVIGQDPETGEDVVGIDQITISAENCEIVDEEDLTATLDDQGEPFRVINGVDVDITVDDEGVTINGRETIEGTVNGVEINEPNPDQIISGFEVEQDDTPEDLSINDMFPVVSTTGIGGEGCAEVADLDTTPDTDTTDDVDTGDDLPNTGGGPADTSTALLFVVSGFALLAMRIVKLRRGA